MAAASDVSPQSAYIQHHLVHLNNTGEKQSAIAQFDVINYDSLFWSALTGLIVIFFLWRAAHQRRSGPPAGLRGNGRGHGRRPGQGHRPQRQEPSVRGPAGLTVFLWIILMNALDLLPVDLLPSIWRWTGLGAEHGDPLYYHRILPTADLNVPMGMSLGVLLLMFYYGIKIKHPGGFVKELFTAPFHAHGIAAVVLAPSTCC